MLTLKYASTNLKITLFYFYLTYLFFRNEPLSSLKFLIIAKEILKYGSPNEQFKVIICDILKQPYWIHLYPELYHQLYGKVINVSYILT